MITTFKRAGTRLLALALSAGLLLTACSDAGQPAEKLPPPTDPAAVVVQGVPSLEQMYAGAFGEPPNSSPGPVENKSVWWITCGSNVAVCVEPGLAAQEAGREVGIDVTIADGKLNVSNAQSTAIRSAIAAGADGIITFGIACSAIRQALVEAKTAGVPVMGAVGSDCDVDGGESLFTAPMSYSEEMPDALAYFREMGAQSARYIIDRTEGRAKLIYNYNVEAGHLRVAHEGFMEEWNKCETCEIVGEIEWVTSDHAPGGPWTDALRNALLRYPEANSLYLDWDVEMTALGGVQAVSEAGRKDNMIVFGGEGVAETFDLVREGRIDALTKVTSRDWLGYGAIDNMLRALHGQPAVPQGIGLVVTDAEHNLPATKGETWEGPAGIDFKRLYRESWERAGQPVS